MHDNQIRSRAKLDEGAEVLRAVPDRLVRASPPWSAGISGLAGDRRHLMQPVDENLVHGRRAFFGTQCPQPERRWLLTSPGMVDENASITFWIQPADAS